VRWQPRATTESHVLLPVGSTWQQISEESLKFFGIYNSQETEQKSSAKAWILSKALGAFAAVLIAFAVLRRPSDP
jgi:hypothetical protein